MHDREDLITELIEHGAAPFINAPTSDGVTPLLCACQEACFRAGASLVDLGASVTLVSQQGETPLLAAVQFADSNTAARELVQRLLHAGADPSATMRTTGETCLHRACRVAAGNAIELLLRHGANASIAVRGVTPIDLLLSYAHVDQYGALRGARALLAYGARASREAVSRTNRHMRYVYNALLQELALRPVVATAWRHAIEKAVADRATDGDVLPVMQQPPEIAVVEEPRPVAIETGRVSVASRHSDNDHSAAVDEAEMAVSTTGTIRPDEDDSSGKLVASPLPGDDDSGEELARRGDDDDDDAANADMRPRRQLRRNQGQSATATSESAYAAVPASSPAVTAASGADGETRVLETIASPNGPIFRLQSSSRLGRVHSHDGSDAARSVDRDASRGELHVAAHTSATAAHVQHDANGWVGDSDVQRPPPVITSGEQSEPPGPLMHIQRPVQPPQGQGASRPSPASSRRQLQQRTPPADDRIQSITDGASAALAPAAEASSAETSVGTDGRVTRPASFQLASPETSQNRSVMPKAAEASTQSASSASQSQSVASYISPMHRA